METMQVPDYKADICTAFARGNLGKAKMLASSEEFDKVNYSSNILYFLSKYQIINIVGCLKQENIPVPYRKDIQIVIYFKLIFIDFFNGPQKDLHYK